MSLATPGRNDVCPCGTGRKYKRCCLEKDAQAPRPAPPSPLILEEVLFEASNLVASKDIPALREAMTPMWDLFATMPELRRVRFPDELFSKEMSHELRRGGAELNDDDDDFPRVGERVASRLPVESIRSKLNAALDVALTAGRLPRAALKALAVTSLLNTIEEAQPRAEAHFGPVIELLLRVQTAEWLEARRVLNAELDALVGSYRSGELGPKRLQKRAHPGLFRKLSTLFPGFTRTMEKTRKEVTEDVCEAMRRPNPPALLTRDEWLWIAAEAEHSRALANTRAPEPKELLKVTTEIIDDAFVDDVTERLVALAATHRTEQLPAKLAVAWHAEPTFLTLCAVVNPSRQFVSRGEEEDALWRELSAASPEWLARWERFLAGRGEARAAARVRRIVELEGGGASALASIRRALDVASTLGTDQA